MLTVNAKTTTARLVSAAAWPSARRTRITHDGQREEAGEHEDHANGGGAGEIDGGGITVDGHPDQPQSDPGCRRQEISAGRNANQQHDRRGDQDHDDVEIPQQ